MRIVLLTVLLCLTLVGAAGAQERLCRGVISPPPPIPTEAQREQRQLEEWAETRKGFGFRHGLAYVRRLAEQGRFLYNIPVTKAERAYLFRRGDLDLGAAGRRYLDRRERVSAGISVEDGWPGEPFLRVRFTRDVQRHLAALRALVPEGTTVRGTRVRYSTRALEQIRDRVYADDEALEAAGFHFQVSGTDITANRFEIQLATARTDAKAYFRQRYGGRVKVVVTAKSETVDECTSSFNFRIEPDGRLTVGYNSGGGAVFVRAEVTETPERIEVGIVQNGSTGPRNADYHPGTATITPAAPLGDRAVIDAATGRRLRQAGPTPGDPPCPPFDPTRGPGAEELREAEDAVDEYLLRNDDVYGGYVIEGKAVVFGFTKDRARHERALERRSKLPPSRIRTRTVAFTQDALNTLARRIKTDAFTGNGFLDGYGRAGFFLVGTEIPEFTLTVQVVTARPDAAAFFAARYGPAVHVEVVGDRFECAEPLD